MISITKIFRFEAAHQLPFHEGKCKNLHGHQYVLEIEVTGKVQREGPEVGMICDFGKLKQWLGLLLDDLDHQYLNDRVENPTAENLVLGIVSRVKACLPAFIKLVRIRLWETADSYCEWRE